MELEVIWTQTTWNFSVNLETDYLELEVICGIRVSLGTNYLEF